MENKLKCDVCGVEEFSEDLFWRDGGIDTDNQFKVSEYLTEKGHDVCCDVCFKEILLKKQVTLKVKIPLKIKK